MNYYEINQKITSFKEKYPNFVTSFDAALEFDSIPELKCGNEKYL